MKDTDVEIKIHGTPTAPRVVEVDASIIAEIVRRETGANNRKCTRVANLVADYLSIVFSQNRGVQ